MSQIKRVIDEIQEFYDRLYEAQKHPMTPAARASFEAELALLKAKFPFGKESQIEYE